jgi:hypothetical protein
MRSNPYLTVPLLTPATAPLTSDIPVTGFVCVRPDGEPFWPSAHGSASESLRACFGPADPWRLDDLARDGWRCVPIAALARPA